MLEAVGVSLVDTVNPYLQADRASKYGLLFVILTMVMVVTRKIDWYAVAAGQTR